jgi:acetyl esterase
MSMPTSVAKIEREAMPAHIAPDVAHLLRAMMPSDAPPLDTLPPAAVRAGVAATAAASPLPKREIGSVENAHIAGPGGPLPVRIYRPGTPGPAPTIVFCHGGGFIMCNLDTHDEVCRDLCADVGAVVVSVDYRLAPEHPFPAALDDTCAAARWARERVAELGGDAQRLVLAGDSAGGNLVLAAALRLAHEEAQPPAAVLALYPATDLRLPSRHASVAQLGGGEFGLTQRDMAWFSELYLPRPTDADRPEASPLLATRLASMPPTLLVVCEADPLRDEGLAMADALRRAGVRTELLDAPGMPHGFFSMGSAPSARSAINQVVQTLSTLLAR